MPTITGTITDAAGNGFAAEISFLRIGGPGVVGGSAYSRTITTTTCEENGAFSLLLMPGYWRMRWYSADLANELLLAVPASGGPYDLEDVTTDGGDNMSSFMPLLARQGRADLRAVTNYVDKQMEYLAFLAVDGDGQGGWFTFAAAATGTDDGLNTLLPDDLDPSEAGRWLRQLNP